MQADLDERVPVKQRHTARRVWQRLVDEHDAQVPESSVRKFVAQVKAELTNVAEQVTVVQEHTPGEQAEVDFGKFKARIGGELVRVWLFTMPLSASGRGFAVAHQAQESFFEGHVLAFDEAAVGLVDTRNVRRSRGKEVTMPKKFPAEFKRDVVAVARRGQLTQAEEGVRSSV